MQTLSFSHSYQNPRDLSFGLRHQKRENFENKVFIIYKKETDPYAFAAQLVKMTGVNTIQMGSLSNPKSFISRIWRNVTLIAKEKRDGIFILQDIQNKDIEACGNARQRGKVALSKRRVGQMLLPSPLKDLPYGDPSSDDPYWKSLRGWENCKTVSVFIKFVEKVVQELKDKVDFWITLGEPVASIVGLGYISGIWSPGFFLDGDRAKRALHNLIEAHVKAYNIITDTDDVDADGDGFSGGTTLHLTSSAIKIFTNNNILLYNMSCNYPYHRRSRKLCS